MLRNLYTNKSVQSILPILLGGGIVLLGCLFIGGALYFALATPQNNASETPAAAISESTRSSTFPTATMPPSATPTPTVTSTPAPTQTPTPTNTSVPPTSPPATKVPPTAVPTETEIPPTTAPPGSQHGIQLLYLQTSASFYAKTEPVKYEYVIKNVTSGKVGFGFLGANLVDNAGNVLLFKLSWEGNNAATKWIMNPTNEILIKETITGPSNAGTYYIHAVICYSFPGECNTPGAGEWETLGIVSFTIN